MRTHGDPTPRRSNGRSVPAPRDGDAVTDPRRLRAVRRSGLTKGDHPNLERYTRMAAAAIGAPVSLFSVLDDSRQHFVVQVGLDGTSPKAKGSSLDESYCRTVVNTEAPLLVRDAADDTWAAHPGTSYFGIGAYAGVPVHSPEGTVLGSLCVIDSERHAWTDGDIDVLRDLADAIETEIALRATTRSLERLLERQRRKNRFEQALLTVAAAANRSAGIDATVAALVEHGAAVVDASMITLGIVEDDEIVFHHGPGVDETTSRSWARASLELDLPMVRAATGTGEPLVLFDPADLARFPAMTDDVERLGLRSFMALPVLDPDADLRAAIGLGWTEPLDPDDPIVDDVAPLGRLTGQALGRAVRYDAARSQAQLLEQLIIPSSLPEIEGVDLRARYLPPTRTRRVGGDLYDAVVRDDGAIGVIVADAVGHDLEASRTAARVRHAVGALTLEGVEPAALLEAVNHYLRRSSNNRLITCSYWLLHPDHRTITLANAGHPQPRLLTAEGVRSVGPSGQPLLGAVGDAVYTQETLVLTPGSTLVGFTDGLIERRNRPMQDSEADFEALLANIGGESAKVLVDTLVAEALSTDREDDVAVVAIGVRSTDEAAVRSATATHAWRSGDTDLKVCRRLVADFLAECGQSALGDTAALITTELVSNARNASQPDTPIELTLGLDNAGFEIIVTNRGETFDDANPMPAPEAERGRGLALIRAMARDLHATFDEGRTTITVRLDAE